MNRTLGAATGALLVLVAVQPASGQLQIDNMQDEPVFQNLQVTRAEVLDEHYRAIGGRDDWDAVTSMRMIGTMRMPGIQVPVTILARRPNLFRLELNLEGSTGVEAYDGRVAWRQFPFEGDAVPQAVPAHHAEILRTGADFDGPLFDYADKGHEVELIARRTLEGLDVFELEVTLSTGAVERWYLDAAQYLRVRVDSSITDAEGNTVQMERMFRNYRPVEKLMLPFEIITRAFDGTSQSIQLDTIELNVDLDDSLFTPPQMAPPDPAEAAAAP